MSKRLKYFKRKVYWQSCWPDSALIWTGLRHSEIIEMGI